MHRWTLSSLADIAQLLRELGGGVGAGPFECLETHPLTFDHRHQRLNLIVFPCEFPLEFAVSLCPADQSSHLVPLAPATAEVGITLLAQLVTDLPCHRGIRGGETILHDLWAITPGACVDFEPEPTDRCA